MGIQNFDLITSNEHLHFNEVRNLNFIFTSFIFLSIKTIRNIISQITILWDICRKDRKTTNTSSENTSQSTINERTWRPWVRY